MWSYSKQDYLIGTSSSHSCLFSPVFSTFSLVVESLLKSITHIRYAVCWLLLFLPRQEDRTKAGCSEDPGSQHGQLRKLAGKCSLCKTTRVLVSVFCSGLFLEPCSPANSQTWEDSFYLHSAFFNLMVAWFLPNPSSGSFLLFLVMLGGWMDGWMDGCILTLTFCVSVPICLSPFVFLPPSFSLQNVL